ncbi:hypothetical protein [Acinetobacter sp. Ac_5812]|uniref:hypothetical protein n=1 Tax=Acinetobacter sp. Ac_5812 TaxID=1848937 RepID=UPI001DFB861D|nr:hypothetical protein [Acinetobacter sp. Ac_5812]NNP70404.1 hypothetical protein [Acinetobacter sp. Ac_5812]
MRISHMSLMGVLGAIFSGTSAIAGDAIPRSHSKFTLPEYTPTKVDKKPNKVSQKKRRLKLRRLGHK